MDWSSVESADDCLEVHPLAPYHCHAYWPGHEMHWIHWKRLRNNPSSPVAKVTLRRGFVEVAFAHELAPVLWWHHDLDRLIASLRVSDGDDLEAWPEWHALRVRDTLFNCGESATACSLPVRRSAV
jgi:hypothetical protein